MTRSRVAALVALTLMVATASPVLAADEPFLSGDSKRWKRVTTSGFPETPDFLAVTTNGRFVAIEDLAMGSGAMAYSSRDGRAWQPMSTSAKRSRRTS